MARMRLIDDSGDARGDVTLRYRDADDIDNVEVCRRFTVPASRDGRTPLYVIEHLGSGRTAQVCEELASTGNTLMATPQSLARVIRHEYRAMRRAEKRWS